MIRKFARRLRSMSAAAQQYWATAPQPGGSLNARLTLEGVESRVVPTVTASVAGSVLILTNDAVSNEAITIDTTTNAGFITVLKAATGTNNVTAGTGTTATGTGAKVAVAGISSINITTDTTKFLQVTLGSIAGATDLRQVSYTGSTNNASDLVDFSAGDAPNVFYNVDLKAGMGDTFKAPTQGVAVLSFSDVAAASNVTITPSATNSKFALNFKGVTTPVQVNLNSNPGSQLGSYTNQSITLAGGTSATNITAVYGGSGNDTLIGNDQANLLIGGGGNDILIGNGGNDQLNADRDFSPALAGTPTAGVNVVSPTTLVDLTKFAGLSSALGSASGTTTGALVSSALYNSFGFFNFGEGVAFTNGGTVNATTLGADFATANGISVATASQDRLFGGDGNDGLYGFNNSAATSFGEGGNDVISSNTLALAATLDGGDGDDLLIGGITGFTLQGQGGNDTFQFAPGTPTAVNTVIGGAGNDIFQTAIKSVTLDASQGTDTFSNPTPNVGIANDPSVILTTTAGTVVNLAALPMVQKTVR